MLESLASTLLNRILGSYVENFDPTQLNVGIWSGNVRLTNLKLRKDCLDGLNLPVDVQFGVLGELLLTVPWSSLKNKPVKISIEECYLLCKPRDNASMHSQEQIERELRVKLQKLAEWELTNQARTAAENPNGQNNENESFMQSLMTKIVDNLQITFKNIHIRYEDMSQVLSKEPCSIGITLSELSAVSTDSGWTPSFISMTQDVTHKLLTLNSLCLYWNTKAATIEEEDDILDHDILISKFKNAVATGGKSIPSYQYMLKPVTGSGRLSVNKLGTTAERPHIELNVLFDELGFELDDSEYADILHTMSSLHLSQKTQKFKKKRPDYSTKENATGWFKYVASCVLDEIHEKNEAWTWEHIKERADQRRLYIQLWMKKLQQGDIDRKLPDSEDEKKLDEIQRLLDFDTLVLFRSVAKKQYAKKRLTTREAASSTPEQQTSAQGGWFSSWWGGGKEASNKSEDLLLTDEQRQELYDAIEFDEKHEEIETQIPKDRTTMKITGSLKKGALSIKNRALRADLGEIIFGNCELEFLQRSGSFLASFKLHEFKIEDGSPNTLYKHIVSVKNLKSDNVVDVDGNPEPLFKALFESNPLDESADSKVDVKLRGMTIFYHVHFINEIIRFFNPPKQHRETITAIINAAEATVEGWTTQTRMGIESLLEEHKTANITLDLQAPLIIIPLDPHVWDTPCAVIDAGHIALVSDLVPKQRIEKIRQMSPEEYETIDDVELKGLMFDRFQLYLQNTQILVGPDVRSTISSLSSTKDGAQYTILSGLLLELTLDISILPKAYNLPRAKAFGHLKKLDLSLNDFQYKVIMQLLDKSMPTFTDFESDIDLNEQYAAMGNEDKKLQIQLEQTIQALEKMTPAQVAQKLFQLEFKVDSIQISLYKCVDNSSMSCKKLVDFLGGKLRLTFVKKAKEMALKLNVHSIDVVDFIEQTNNKEFQYLISSGTTGPNEGKDLFSVDYVRRQRIVLHDNLHIEVFDQDIKMDMEQLRIVLTPKSILTLMNYALTTFTDPATEVPADALRHNKENRDDAPQKINMAVNMAGMVIILNDDSLKLATLVLSAGEFSMFLLPEKMKVTMSLGGLELTDEVSESLPRDSVFRRVITMSDNELAELTYETFDPTSNPHNYDSVLKYTAGSLHVNFIEQSINKLINFFYKFQKMKNLFDKARELAYDQAPSIESVNNLKMDILIKAPIIEFPKLIDPRNNVYDNMKFYLGEFFIQNSFSDRTDSHKVNTIKLGVRDGQLSSSFNLEDGGKQLLHMIDNMCLAFDVEHDLMADASQPVFKVKGYFDPLKTSLTELQLRYLTDISEKVTAAFDISEPTSEELGEDEIYASALVDSTVASTNHSSPLPDGPQENPEHPEGLKLDFEFEAPEISLTLFNDTAKATELEKKGLTVLTFQDIALKAKYNNDGTGEAESHIATFSVVDIRDRKDNKHTELIPKVVNDNYQFMSSLTAKNLNDGRLINLSVTIDSPQVILATDYLFALQHFSDAAFAKQTTLVDAESPQSEGSDEDTLRNEPSENGTKFQYSLNVVNAAVILLADPSDLKSEAVIFNVGQFLLSDQNISALSANNVGMSIGRMNSDNEQKVRLLDEFSSSLVVDKRNSTPERLLTNIQVSVEPLVLSISLRDIRLAMQIFNRLMSQMNDNTGVESTNDEISNYGAFSKEFEKKLSKYAPSLVSSLNASTRSYGGRGTKVETVLRGEKLEADFGGLRLLLIGDVHELPILDMNVNPFQASVKDWSTDIDALATLEMYVNVFNYSRSSWEPLVEEFPISFHLSKGSERDALIRFDAISRKVAELTLSSRTIAMLSQIPSTLTGDINLSSRGAQKPYKIINDTEFDLDIWIASDDPKEQKGLTTLKARGSIPWEFEDWRTIREKLDVDSGACNLAAVVAGSDYTTTMKIDATLEGELLFVLQPAINHIHNRLTCDLQLGEDNVKTITFRSTLVLENTTSVPVLLKVEPVDGSEPIVSAIDPSKNHSVPVGYSYDSKLRIKPSCDEDYEWSEQVISWRDLLKSSLSVECRSPSDPNRKFYLEVSGKFDSKEPLAKIYPRMTIIVSPPLVIENLLSSDLNFTLFDKKQEHRILTMLEKSSKVPIHDVSLDNFLLLSIQPLVDDAPLSKPVIVNAAARSSLKPEKQITTKLAGGQTFRAALHYQNVEGTRAKVLKISAPYIILNKTDRDLYIRGDRTNIAQIKVQTSGSERYTSPKMFSFNTDVHNKNRACVRFKESDWSTPLSFDAIGQSLDSIVNIPNKEQESNIGVTISEGEGEYAFSKIVEIAPRYIIHNCLDLPIEICELGSTNVSQLDSDHSKPLYRMRNIVNKQLMIKFLGPNCDWSAPFFIKDIGLTYLKVLKQDSSHMLLKVEIILENATVFIRLKDANNRWPYSIRNFSDQEFIFYQRDPRVVDDYYDYDSYDELSETEYKPFYYRLPPKSVMPYAWDYPAARQKKIVITARGLRREIQLAEIGNLKPMRLPAKLADEKTITVDLNVVADGPTQALVITKYNPEVSLYKLRSKKTSSSLSVNSSADGFEADEEDKNIYKKIIVSLKGVGISLINASLQEIMYVHISGLELRYNESDLYQTLSWKLKWVQVDNQLFGSLFQNVLYPAAVLHTAQEIENHPVVSGSVSKVKDNSHGLIYFKHATLLLQELSIQLDEELLISLLDFAKFPGAVWNKYATQAQYSDTITLPECEEIKFADDMYFEIFHLQPMLLHISFVRSDQHNFLESEQNRLGLDSRGTVLFLVDMLTMTLANVNDAPIKLNSLYMANVRVPINTLMQAIQTHYGQQFFYQIHKILGSADFLGNPVGLFNTISSGVWDIFYEPYQGYMMNDRPQELGIHLAKGGLSFAKKTVFGLSDSMAKFTGSMAKGLSFTQDPEFQEKRRLQQRMNANRRNLLSSTAQTFANTIGSGFTGMALDPMNGAQKEGAAGFIKGLGKGLFGLPTKTAIGFLDLTSNLSQGVKSTASALDGPASMRVRLPRYVDCHEKIIRPFNLKDSQGQYWLKSVDGGLYMSDNYLTHVVLPGRELAVLVSMEHILEINIAAQETMWATDYYGIQGIVLQRGGIHIRLKTRSEYFVPVSDAYERKQMYKHIATAVTEYNKYCEATL